MTLNSEWTFLTNHAHILLCIAEKPDSRLRDLAQRVGITERAVQGIVADLSQGKYLEVVRVGRRNAYVVSRNRAFRHEVEKHKKMKDLIDLIIDKAARGKRSMVRHSVAA